MEKMVKYNHKKNAGNKADVWKHEVLLRTIDVLKPKTYFETHCGFPYYNKGRMLLSSYMKVRMEIDCKMTLCDIDGETGFNIPVGMDMIFINANGWEYIHKMADHDLYFIDPSYSTMFDLITLVALLEDDTFTKPLMAWYPIFKNTHLTNYDFGLPKLEYMFNEKELMGCGMVFKNFPNNVLKSIEKLGGYSGD